MVSVWLTCPACQHNMKGKHLDGVAAFTREIDEDLRGRLKSHMWMKHMGRTVFTTSEATLDQTIANVVMNAWSDIDEADVGADLLEVVYAWPPPAQPQALASVPTHAPASDSSRSRSPFRHAAAQASSAPRGPPMPTNLLLILNNMAQVQNEQHSQIKDIHGTHHPRAAALCRTSSDSSRVLMIRH